MFKKEEDMMRRKNKGRGKMLKKIIFVVVILVIVLFTGSFYLGIYNSVNVKKATVGPYQIVCLDHIGPYQNIRIKIQNVKKLLDDKGIIPLAACGIYYDDPKSVPSEKLRSKGGWLVEDNVDIEILENVNIPEREVVVAKVKAHPAIAPIKTFPKIHTWLIANNFVPSGPCLEIYHNNKIVEVQMPISPKQEEEI